MTTPTWQELRDNGWMVVDQTTLLLGVYPSDSGAVAIAFAHPQDETMQGCRLDPTSVPLLLKQLELAQGYAQKQQRDKLETAAVKLAFDVIERVKAGG